MTDTAVLEQLTETELRVREVNTGLMVVWINQDLFNRHHHDVRTSLVLYDQDKLFVGALPPVLAGKVTPELSASLHKAGVRYYSTGIV